MSVLEIPAAPVQQRLWALMMDAPADPIYQIGLELINAGPLDLGCVQAALREVIARHEALRTDFHLVDGVLSQRVQAPPDTVPVDFLQIRGGTPQEVAEEYERTRTGFAARRLDTGTAPLLRAAVIRRPGLAPPFEGPYDTIVIVAHHLVLDAWSADIMQLELLAAYLAHQEGRSLDLEPVGVQYADFCAWQSAQADAAACARDLAFWRDELADLAELDLTRGRPRPEDLPHTGGRLDVRIGPEETELLRRFAHERRATPFMVLHAAFSAALGRVFGSTDIAIGANVSTRVLPDTANTIGVFIERVVLRVNVGGEISFDDLVNRSREAVLSAHDHIAPGFSQIVAAVNPRRRPGVAPLAQVSFNLQPAITGGRQELRSALRRAQRDQADDPFRLRMADDSQFGNGAVQHDLGLDLGDRTTHFEGVLEYRDGVVSEADAQRVLSLTRRFLEAGLNQPQRPLAAVATLAAGELGEILAAYDGGPAGQGAASAFPDLVTSWAAATPEALAVDAHDGQLTYRELAAAATDLASRLRAHGVGAEQAVIVMLPRGVALPVALLGVHTASGVYVPVDPLVPPGYLARVVEATGARVAVTAAGPSPALPAGVAAVPLDGASLIPPGNGAALAAPSVVSASGAAYILFTSGSTGRPKGVVVEHRNLSAYLSGILSVTNPHPGAVHLLVQNPAFDASLTTICGALASGGVLRIVHPDVATDPHLLGAALAGTTIDYLKITPSHLAALLSDPSPDLIQILRPRRALVIGGETISQGLTDLLLSAGWPVVSQYGPTETTVGVLAGAETGQDPRLDRQPGSGLLGGPLPGVRVYVLDEQGLHVPPGCAGELHVSGELVARGYACAPAATAQVYLPDPYARVPGARMYRTGDLVRCRGDGTLVFLGRRDRQVKIRGHRVEPAAVETLLRAQPGVAQAAAVIRGPAGSERLVAYVTPAAPGSGAAGQGRSAFDLNALRAALSDQLPAHALPSSLVAVDDLPLTRSGKLDAAALPDPDDAADDQDAPDDDPATSGERQLAEIWRGVLRRDRVPVQADFFDLGGDSIRAVQVVAQARAQGWILTTRDLLRHRTIRSLANALGHPARETPADPRNHRSPSGWAGVTSVRLPRTAGALARLAPYIPPTAEVVDVQVGEDSVELRADADGCDDHTLARLATALLDPTAPLPPLPSANAFTEGRAAPLPPAGAAPAGGAAAARASASAERVGRAPLSARMQESLAGAAHDAYGTDPVDLAAAAVARALRSLGSAAPGRLFLTDIRGPSPARAAGQRARPGLIDFPASEEPGELVQAAKAAVRAARAQGQAGGPAGVDPPAAIVRVLALPPDCQILHAEFPEGSPAVLIAGGEVLATADPPMRAGQLAMAVADALAAIAEHCVGQAPVYVQADFPAASLSQQELARLLTSIGADVDEEAR